MTYKSVVVRPGPRVNLVIGPNGAGKSTILCAVVLGLGGEPRLTGRGTTLQSYVRDQPDCQTASIKITLKCDPEDDHINVNSIIERTFTKSSGNSTWRLNGSNVARKAIQKVINHYGIQLDNLTQFLPQDIVGRFSNYSPQQLLRETQKAALGEGYVKEFDEIKKLHDRQFNASGIEQQLETTVKSLENDAEDLSSLLERFLVLKKRVFVVAL